MVRLPPGVKHPQERSSQGTFHSELLHNWAATPVHNETRVARHLRIGWYSGPVRPTQ